MLVGVHTFAGRPAKRSLAARGRGILTVRAASRGQFGKLGRWLVGTRYEGFLKSLLADSVEVGSAYTAMTVLRRLREGGIAHITVDARVSSKSEVLRFLGGEWRFSGGAVELARAARCPLVPFLALYVEGGTEVRFGPAIETGTGLAGVVAAIEAQIAGHEDQWERWEDL
jgi:hypothetical protein